MSKPNKFAALVAQPAAEPSPAPEASRAEETSRPTGESARMLGGRVPDRIFREFQRQKMAAEETMGVRKITTEEGLEALVRMLRDPELLTSWIETLRVVRQERRD